MRRGAPYRGSLSLLLSLSALFVITTSPLSLERGLFDVKTARAQGGGASAKARAKALYLKGKSAFDAEQFPEALEAFLASYEAFPLPLMLFNIASVYESIGDDVQALYYFRRYQKLSGKGDGEVRRLRQQVESWREVRVDSTPPGAKISLFSAALPPRGETPLTLRLPTDRAFPLYLTRAGYSPLEKSYRAGPGEGRGQLTLSLIPLKGEVTVLGSPVDAEVRIDGGIPRQGLPSNHRLPLGEHQLEVRGEGFRTHRQRFEVKESHRGPARLSISVSLEPGGGLGALLVKTDEQGAALIVDGRPSGVLPMQSPLELEEGAHLIEVRGQQDTRSVEVQISAGKTRTLEVDLSAPIFTKERISYGLIGLGGTLLVGGLVMGSLALGRSSALDECRDDSSCARRQGELDLATELRDYSLSADLLIGAGLLVGAAGGALYWFQVRSQSPQQRGVVNEAPNATSSLQLLPGWGGLSLRGQF